MRLSTPNFYGTVWTHPCLPDQDKKEDMARSNRMGPSELAKWLVNACGEEYRGDINKLEEAMINEELFLDFLDNKEPLEELKLSFGFKMLVKKKAKELKQRSGAVDTDGHAPSKPPSNGQGSGTSTDTREDSGAQARSSQVSTVLRSTDQLTPDHLQQVLDVMWPARIKASAIGLALGLAPDVVEATSITNNFRVDIVFIEMMKECLRQGLVTQKKLADAVGSKQISFGYLKDTILDTKFTSSETAPPPPRPAPVPVGVAIKGKKLTLLLLGSLKTKSVNEKINIIQQVAPYWRDFATRLDFDPNGTAMQTIGKKNPNDPEECCRETMQLWLNGRGRQPATFELLLEILRDCNLIVLAEQVEEAIPYN